VPAPASPQGDARAFPLGACAAVGSAPAPAPAQSGSSRPVLPLSPPSARLARAERWESVSACGGRPEPATVTAARGAGRRRGGGGGLLLGPAGTMSIEIPPGLTELLQGYTVEVLRHRPADLVGFAADYFTRLRDAREQEATGDGRRVISFDGEPMQTESNGEEEPERGDEESDSDFARE